jgi:hypothetical protein
MRLSLLTLLLAASACARATGAQSDAATDTTVVDTTIDGNGCSSQPCSILPQCGCGGANACDVDISDGKGTSCRAVTDMGHENSACSMIYQCDTGYVCIGGTGASSCKKYCSADVDCGSPRGKCVIDITANGTPIAGIPPVCSSNCEPTSTNPTECPPTFKCGMFTVTHNGTTQNIADCSPAGTGNQGASCVSGTNGDDKLCNKGYLCSTTTADTAFKCRRVCQKAAPNCGQATCLSFNPPLTIAGTEYGICN